MATDGTTVTAKMEGSYQNYAVCIPLRTQEMINSKFLPPKKEATREKKQGIDSRAIKNKTSVASCHFSGILAQPNEKKVEIKKVLDFYDFRERESE